MEFASFWKKQSQLPFTSKVNHLGIGFYSSPGSWDRESSKTRAMVKPNGSKTNPSKCNQEAKESREKEPNEVTRRYALRKPEKNNEIQRLSFSTGPFGMSTTLQRFHPALNLDEKILDPRSSSLNAGKQNVNKEVPLKLFVEVSKPRWPLQEKDRQVQNVRG